MIVTLIYALFQSETKIPTVTTRKWCGPRRVSSAVVMRPFKKLAKKSKMIRASSTGWCVIMGLPETSLGLRYTKWGKLAPRVQRVLTAAKITTDCAIVSELCTFILKFCCYLVWLAEVATATVAPEGDFVNHVEIDCSKELDERDYGEEVVFFCKKNYF